MTKSSVKNREETKMICNKCGMQNNDDAAFCLNCGESFSAQQGQNSQPNQQWQQPYNQQPYGQQIPYRNPYDHTAEFDHKDICDNKVYAMLPYLLGWIGVIVALLASKLNTSGSSYTEFHVRQSLKLTVVNNLLMIVALVLCWTFIVPVVCVIMWIILWVVKIIGFFSVCSGNAKELPIIRSLGFLN